MVDKSSRKLPEQTTKNNKNISFNKNEVFGICEDDENVDILKNKYSTEKLTVSRNEIFLQVFYQLHCINIILKILWIVLSKRVLNIIYTL